MGEQLALDVGGVFAAILLAVVLGFLVVSVRRWLFERAGGTVECSLRTLPSGGSESDARGASKGGPDGEARDGSEAGAEPDATAGVWRLGLGRYKGDELHWHRIFGFRKRPRQVIHRRGLVVSNRRRPEGDEVAALVPDADIIEVRDGELTVELAMSGAALTGFLAWLEAAPPGLPIDFPN
ncbi:DUF2550 domain-containing protein [Actinomadura sp. HBU206391]|uniref:DUF2550 domain-containing protein n=1 Tax=Actinomadura sp. HBU206391 TaxID=2731692 RepID=UPI00164F5B97|nr:DUF2550 domain-containing protein [Actinomadura sp. HBU206391]MBC6458052.1 DUF2550 domain-containing protein [Actinomadura sp. HBU206391]